VTIRFHFGTDGSVNEYPGWYLDDLSVMLPPPIITGFTPSFGAVRTNVTIIGSNFGTAGSVYFNSTLATNIISWTNDSIVVSVPFGAGTGPIMFSNAIGVFTTSSNFIMITPVITGFSPLTGSAGTLVTITGSNFSSTGSVFFKGVVATNIISWSNTQVQVTVPFGALTGPVSISNSMGLFVTSSNFVVPQPAAALPFFDGFESGFLSPYWKISNTFEGRVRVTTNYPYQGSYSVLLDDSVDAGATSIASVILNINLAGEQYVYLSWWWREFGDENHAQDGVFISDDDGVNWYRIFSFNNGPTIFQSNVINLDQAIASNGLSYNDHFKVKFQFYDNDSIPGDGYAIDNVSVLSIPPPIITGFSPPGGDVGTSVSIFGSNFGTNGSVNFNGVPATNIISWANNTIIVSVPSGTTTGPIAVSNTIGGDISSANFVFTTNIMVWSAKALSLSNIEIEFSKELDIATATNLSNYMVDGVSLSAGDSISYASNKVIINLASFVLSDTAATPSVWVSSNVSDISNVKLDSNTTLIAQDQIPPEFLTVETGDDDLDGYIDYLQLTFSEDVIISNATGITIPFIPGFNSLTPLAFSNQNGTNNQWILYLSNSKTGPPDTGNTPDLNYTGFDIFDAFGNPLASNGFTNTSDATPPVLLTNANAYSSSRVTINFSESMGNFSNISYYRLISISTSAVSTNYPYKIEVDQSSVTNMRLILHFSNTLPDPTNMTVFVTSSNLYDNSSPANYINLSFITSAVAILADFISPSMPANLVCHDNYTDNGGKIFLSWQVSADGGGSGLAGYRIYLSLSPSGPFILASTVLGISNTVTIVYLADYYFGVSAFDGAGNESPTNFYENFVYPVDNYIKSASSLFIVYSTFNKNIYLVNPQGVNTGNYADLINVSNNLLAALNTSAKANENIIDADAYPRSVDLRYKNMPERGVVLTMQINANEELKNNLRIFTAFSPNYDWIFPDNKYQTVHESNRTVTLSGEVGSGIYKVFEARLFSDDLGKVQIGPNPAKGSDVEIRIANLPRNVTIEVYTIYGALVATLNKNDNNGELIWNGLSGEDDNGMKLGTGVYLLYIKNEEKPEDTRVMKLAIIR